MSFSKRRRVSDDAAELGFAKAIEREHKRVKDKIHQYLNDNPDELAQWWSLMDSGTMKRGKSGRRLDNDDDKKWGRSQQRFKNTSLAYQKELFSYISDGKDFSNITALTSKHLLQYSVRVSVVPRAHQGAGQDQVRGVW